MLKKELATIDQTIVEMRNLQQEGTQDASWPTSSVFSEKRSQSLQADVLREIENSEIGISAKEIAERLRESHLEKFANWQSLLASVHTTVKRLLARGKIAASQGDKGLIFIRPIFQLGAITDLTTNQLEK